MIRPEYLSIFLVFLEYQRFEALIMIWDRVGTPVPYRVMRKLTVRVRTATLPSVPSLLARRTVPSPLPPLYPTRIVPGTALAAVPGSVPSLPSLSYLPCLSLPTLSGCAPVPPPDRARPPILPRSLILKHFVNVIVVARHRPGQPWTQNGWVA